MLKRKVSVLLNDWKSTPDKKCLLVQGARQVGKTYAIRQFAKVSYKEYLELNFKENPDLTQIFSGDLDPDSLILGLRFRFPHMSFDPDKTLLFFDEIQECPEAITSLKFWTDDGRYDVIASGSLLGIDYKRPSSYPVGYVEYIKMHALDFEEFLWALGIDESMILSLKGFFENRKVIPEAVHNQMMNLFRQFMAIGGMPEVVQNYVDNRDFVKADTLQRQILQGYLYDIAHYAESEEKTKAEKCFLSLSRQLLDKENHKFQYKEVESGGRAQKYYSSIDWLINADIIQLSRNVSNIQFDLDDYADSSMFRAYTHDISLLLAMKDFGFKQRIIENSLVGSSKGGIYECAIADILIKKGYKLYYYKNDTIHRELDFMFQKDGRIVLLEVKSSNQRATSLNKIAVKKNDIAAAYKLINGNIGDNESGIITIPLYMAMFF